ncbi:hypothetical protein KBZ18_08975 [Synechococcus sp. Cruz-9H2]|uniref:hypothetical protein n=1 Tax=unclassified Synechococcus TaxID=2626047 RepID=UPI0020CBCD35|nr:MULTISPECIES: hypothetical protein [unclassified Synechococcus]MCP9819625.1 hypothetical protein [Synechococcus sp. Cruz-9H2]MCP9856055.1 hypothetical protein [Synechococcus sp. Cruz-9C9]MCP9870634.1 hypothetical protein [Synechococcus sp. Cruz-7B9]
MFAALLQFSMGVVAAINTGPARTVRRRNQKLPADAFAMNRFHSSRTFFFISPKCSILLAGRSSGLG